MIEHEHKPGHGLEHQDSNAVLILPVCNLYVSTDPCWKDLVSIGSRF